MAGSAGPQSVSAMSDRTSWRMRCAAALCRRGVHTIAGREHADLIRKLVLASHLEGAEWRHGGPRTLVRRSGRAWPASVWAVGHRRIASIAGPGAPDTFVRTRDTACLLPDEALAGVRKLGGRWLHCGALRVTPRVDSLSLAGTMLASR